MVIWVRDRPVVEWKRLWPVAVYYGLHVLGMAWTSDIGFGLFDLQVKLGLVVLPLAALVISKERPEMLHRSMLAFTAGFSIAMVLGLWRAITCFTLDGDSNCFSQSTMSYELHPSYAAWYGCWIVGYWGYRLVARDIDERRLRISLLVLFPILILFIMKLASKSGVIGLGMMLAVLLVVVLMRFRGQQRSVLLLAALVGSTLVIGTQGTLIKARMAAAMDAVSTYMDDPRALNNSPEGSAMRLVAWTCSVERLGMEPFGAGTGDIKHALMECYRAKGATEAEKRKLNSHSQFFQSAVALGWPGLLSIVLLALVPLFHAYGKGSMAYVLFTILFIVNASVESVLEVQAGVVFFAVFLGLLLSERTSRTNGYPKEGKA